MHQLTIIDTNAVLRYILNDIPEQADQVETLLKTALSTYRDTSFDFVDCVLFPFSSTYHIFTFDKKLNRLIDSR